MAIAAIGCDWGTSSLRAYRLAASGAVIDRREASLGIMAIPDDGFEGALEETIGDWLDQHPQIPVILSGMIGSRQGWRETPYLACPADLAGLAEIAVPVPLRRGRDVLIAPGLYCRNPDGTPDVMRGEETQILGALNALDNGPATICLPGTHSKWAKVEWGEVVSFTTHMTGELFAAARDHTILGRMIENESWDDDAFIDGLERAATPGGLLAHLFGLRAKGLFDEIHPHSAAAYLSGVMIGHELAAALSTDMSPIVLIGAGPLVETYERALSHVGRRTELFAPDIAASGHFRLANQLSAGSRT